MLSGTRPLAIWLLESAMLLLILFLLWHPALSVATLRPQQNVVAVLVDDSRSMGIADAEGTREAAAKRALDSGLLKSLGERFQVRLYKFGKEPQRVEKTDALDASEPATRIGDTLERVLAESSSLPLGAIVLLSDGADNAGGVGMNTLAALRRAAHPGSHHRLRPRASSPRRGNRRRRAAGARAAAIAADRDRHVFQFRIRRQPRQAQRARQRESAGQPAGNPAIRRPAANRVAGVRLRRRGSQEFEIGIDPLAGEENTRNNAVTRLVSVEARKPRILIRGRRAALGLQIHPPRAAVPAE